MKTQEELAVKLRKELLDKYRDDENCVNDINNCINIRTMLNYLTPTMLIRYVFALNVAN